MLPADTNRLIAEATDTDGLPSSDGTVIFDAVTIDWAPEPVPGRVT